jgi:Uma2 family endonuclease
MSTIVRGAEDRRTPSRLVLMNGERMTQPEFHRRYLTRPEQEKSELIGGVVYMASPLGQPHGNYHSELTGTLWLYKNATPGVQLLDNVTTILGEEAEPQPDLMLHILPAYGGQSSDTADGYVGGAPELVAEIAHSTRAIALRAKRADYRDAGVREYVVLCIEEQQLYWFDFRAGRPLRPTGGVYRSRVFPGLRIDGPALLARDSKRLMAVVQQGLASAEHARFVKRLEAERRKRSTK